MSIASKPENHDAIVQVTTDSGVTTITLNRPAQFNALSEAMLGELQSAIDSIGKDTRVVRVCGNGRAFCAGHDLKEMRQHPEQDYYNSLFEHCSRVMQSLVALPVPVIAQVQGIATAAGCQLVANCDMAVAADDTRFAVSGINVGLFCSTPSVPLSRNVSRKRAFQMLMTGEFIDAKTAVDWGLINRAVPSAELEQTVSHYCQQIIAKSAVAVSTGKRLFYQQLELPLADAYALAGRTMACNMMSDDVAEGIDAFIAKRPPEWTHQ